MTKSKPTPKTKPAPKPAASNTYRKYGHLWRLTPVDPRRRVDPIRLAAIDREIYILRYYHKIVEQSGKLQPGTMRVMPPGVPLHGVSYNNELMEWKEHLKTLVTLIWDRPDSNRRFKWNPYALRMLDAALEHKYLAVAGHASSGKSVFFAMWGILKFLIGAVHPDKPDTCDPGNVKVFLTSTSLDESRGRIWGDVEMFWNDLIVCVGGEQYLPAKLVSSAGKIIHLDAAGKRNEKAGLILVAGGKGRDADAESKIGFKARSVVMILDELPLLTHSFYKKVFTNLQSNAEFQCIGIGNPTSAFDTFGVFMEPVKGWSSIDEDYMEWETKLGYCIRFNGEKSPNVLAGREIWPGLLTLRYLNEIRAPYGENYRQNSEYYRMVLGFLPPDGDTQAIYTEFGGKEGIAITRPHRLFADDLPRPRKVRRGLHPDRVLRPAPHGKDAMGKSVQVAIGVQHMGRARRDAFQHRAEHVAPRMGQVQAKERPLGQRVMDRRPLPTEIGQAQQALRPLGTGRRLCCQIAKADIPRELVAEPMRQRAGCRKPRHRCMHPRPKPGRIPKPRITHRVRRDLNDKDGGTIHHHHLARALYAHGNRLCRRIDLGLGRAPGTDMATARALRKHMEAADQFPQDVVELLAYLGDPDPAARVRAVPGAGRPPAVQALRPCVRYQSRHTRRCSGIHRGIERRPGMNGTSSRIRHSTTRITKMIARTIARPICLSSCGLK